MRRRTRRPPDARGRPPRLLDAEVQDALLEHLANGIPTTHAAAAVGIHRASFYNWWSRGERAAELREHGQTVPAREQLFLDFFDSATRARAKGQAKAAGLIAKAAEGGYVVRRTTRSYRNADGQRVTELDEVLAPIDWRAAAWFLERIDPQTWARPSQLQVSGPGGGPVEVGVAAYQSMAERLRANLQRVRGELPPGVIEGELTSSTAGNGRDSNR